MNKFPVDAPKARVVGALLSLGFRLVREREHISMIRENLDEFHGISHLQVRNVRGLRDGKQEPNLSDILFLEGQMKPIRQIHEHENTLAVRFD